jgi:hypothetical protein
MRMRWCLSGVKIWNPKHEVRQKNYEMRSRLTRDLLVNSFLHFCYDGTHRSIVRLLGNHHQSSSSSSSSSSILHSMLLLRPQQRFFSPGGPPSPKVECHHVGSFAGRPVWSLKRPAHMMFKNCPAQWKLSGVNCLACSEKQEFLTTSHWLKFNRLLIDRKRLM